jgi:broad specificity phosphatase PhoE
MPDRVFLLRHAETADPLVFHGAESDVGLSARGRGQAEAVAPVLAAFRPGAVVSSALQRARDTAGPIARACRLPVRVEPDLHERRVGALSGTPTGGKEGAWPDTLRRWMAGDTGFAPPGAESFDAIRARVRPVWERLTAEPGGPPLVIVAHSAVCKVLLLSLLPGYSAADWGKLGRSRNVGISELVRADGGWRAVRLYEVPPEAAGPEQPGALRRVTKRPFTCPCCAACFKKFRAHKGREDAKCPKCKARERHRLLWLYLRNKTNLFRDNLKVLHFAPEPWFKALGTLPNLDYLSADLEPGRAMIAMDIMRIPLRDHSIDAIICSHVLEHVIDDRRAMREMYRVLSPGGWAVILVPILNKQQETFEDPAVVSPEERTRLFGQADHCRQYGSDIQKRLEETGFDVELEDYTTELPEQAIKSYGLMPPVYGGPIYLCTKPQKTT